MSWRIYVTPSAKRGELDEILTKDDLLWRQTRIVREAAPLGGGNDELYLYMEGADTTMAHADQKLEGVAKKVEPVLGEKLHAQFKEEEERSAQGMGLMFSD